MANFVGITVSDRVEVTPEQRKALMDIVDRYHFCMEDCQFGNDNEFGIWGYDWLDIVDNDEEYNPVIEEFFDEISDALPEGQKLVVECVGYEKLRYVNAVRIVVVNGDVTYRHLNPMYD